MANNNNDDGYAPNVLCFKCQNRGHIAANCPFPMVNAQQMYGGGYGRGMGYQQGGFNSFRRPFVNQQDDSKFAMLEKKIADMEEKQRQEEITGLKRKIDELEEEVLNLRAALTPDDVVDGAAPGKKGGAKTPRK